MSIFEYPYVIITILVFAFLIMCVVGLIFAAKCVRTANGTSGKDFRSLNKLESIYGKSGKLWENHCVIYVAVFHDTMSRLYSGSGATKMLSLLKAVLLDTFSGHYDGEVSKYGEKSFVAVINCNREQAKSCINKCSEKISRLISENGAVNTIQVRFGYCVTQSDTVNFDTAVSRAKQACIMAERENKSYCEWDNTNGKNLEKKIKIENTINDEIDNNRFFLEYQPVIDVKTGRPVGAEVLARLNSEADGVLTPGAFLPAVDTVGINDKFDYYIFEKNCKWISNNREQRERYVYTINFSRTTLCDPSFAQNIINIVGKYGLRYSAIAIEILEDKNLKPEEKDIVVFNLLRLKEKGVLLLLDDFGIGYTSFMDLNKFNIDIVKIDKSITQNALSESGFLILKNIVNTAKDLKLRTLCEGVENPEHEKAAKDAGCDMVQGYYYYRPMPVTELEKVFGK